MLCWYRCVVASLIMSVVLSVPAQATFDWMERQGTIGHAVNQPDGTRIYLDAVWVAKNKPYQNPAYYVVREPFDVKALLVVLATPPPELRPWQTVDVEGTLTTLPSGDRALVDAKTYGYLDREDNLLYRGPD